MMRLLALPALWLTLSACGVLAADRDPQGTWLGDCDYVLSAPELGIEQEFTFTSQLDITVDGPLASALEVASEPNSEGDRGVWLYDGSWIAPFLDLQDEGGQVIEFTLSTDGEYLAGELNYELEDYGGGQYGSCTFVRSEALSLP